MAEKMSWPDITYNGRTYKIVVVNDLPATDTKQSDANQIPASIPQIHKIKSEPIDTIELDSEPELFPNDVSAAKSAITISKPMANVNVETLFSPSSAIINSTADIQYYAICQSQDIQEPPHQPLLAPFTNEDQPVPLQDIEYNLICDYCHQSFDCKSKMILHLRRHFGIKPFKCKYCAKQFYVKLYLKNHLQSHDGQEEQLLQQQQLQQQQLRQQRQHQQQQQIQKQLQCRLQQQLLQQKKQQQLLQQKQEQQKTEQQRQQRQLLQLEQQRKLLQNRLQQQQLQLLQKLQPMNQNLQSSLTPKATVKKKNFNCPECPAKFSSNYKLDSHVNRHKGIRPFKCNLCPKTYYEPHSLRVHLQTHTGEKNYICEICSKPFMYVCTLNKHRFTHMDEKLFKCDLCEKSFYHPNKLQRHRLTHTDRPRNHICSICSKAYHRPAQLREHMLTHGDEKPYECKVCSMTFKRPVALYQHMYKHKPNRFICDICKKSFANYFRIKSHMIFHIGKRTCICPVCGNAYLRQSNLKIHMDTHSDKKYVCTICLMNFTQAGSLQRHLRVVHHKKNVKEEVKEVLKK